MALNDKTTQPQNTLVPDVAEPEWQDHIFKRGMGPSARRNHIDPVHRLRAVQSLGMHMHVESMYSEKYVHACIACMKRKGCSQICCTSWICSWRQIPSPAAYWISATALARETVPCKAFTMSTGDGALMHATWHHIHVDMHAFKPHSGLQRSSSALPSPMRPLNRHVHARRFGI